MEEDSQGAFCGPVRRHGFWEPSALLRKKRDHCNRLLITSKSLAEGYLFSGSKRLYTIKNTRLFRFWPVLAYPSVKSRPDF